MDAEQNPANFNAAMAKLGAAPGGAQYLGIPGVIQFNRGLDGQMPAGGIWTTSMILSYAFALAGLQSSPAFSILGFSCKDARGFASQQVWALGAVAGLVLLVFAVPQGMGADFLGASKAGTLHVNPAATSITIDVGNGDR